jgi:hypothetical protein
MLGPQIGAAQNTTQYLHVRMNRTGHATETLPCQDEQRAVAHFTTLLCHTRDIGPLEGR